MFSLLVFLLTLITAFGGDMKKLEEYLSKTKTLKVSFIQRVKYEWYPKEDVSKGIFYAERGGKFRLEYYSPDRITIISDGNKIYIINYEEKMVYVEPVSDNTSPVIGSIFLMSEPLSKVFKLVSFSREKEREVYTLKPLREDENITEVKLYINSLGEIEKIVAYDKQNTKTEIDFIELKRNFIPSESLFEVQIPEDFQVKGDG